jgi:hypothetical protein
MIINRYRIRYWSNVDWCWIGETLLAQTESQVIAYVDKQCAPEYRMRLDLVTGTKHQTLEIEDEGPITLPYVID